MSERPTSGRVLIYSHDTFGLGHLRRCRAIAHALVERYNNLSVLILSGSPIVGSFDFRTRVDFVRIPGVIKLRNGEYTALNLHLDIDEILSMRASLIRHTAEIYQPDLFIVDKEPLGLRGEVRETLEDLKRRGVPLVLGLRDVMDEPALLAPEWERKKVLPALENLYDEIWVYGLPQVCDPLEGIEVPQSVRDKMVYTGYLHRTVPAALPHGAGLPEEPYILVTAGGGGDGEALVDWVLRAYESDPGIPYRAVLVFGPFMQPDLQAEFMARAEALGKVEATAFESRMERLMQGAVGVVAMGGYNTFCEILSFDKKALIVPRETPRREQTIRAARAEELGLVSVLMDDGVRDAGAMAAALRRLPWQAPPSAVVVPGLLDGLESVNRLAGRHLPVHKATCVPANVEPIRRLAAGEWA
ncbi:glycosyltransferase family protein [Azospirillum canadense]|uniref:glycosyltransferase family protein n=1 Tax=Azospirillum canadense TaxID=403962 RepID=UPI002226FE8B|nr:glycosyltransferase [Azospirillum canadense]MCW2235499.1 putative glycosyltransferase [Azospirillum canadense]